MRIYYKVVGGPYSSHPMCSVCKSKYFPSQYRVTYKVGEWVKPDIEGTKLYCFSDLDSVKEFINSYCWNNREVSVFSCYAKDVGIPKYLSFINFIKDFWKLKNKRKKINNSFKMTVPKDTRSASEIKLIEEINNLYN